MLSTRVVSDDGRRIPCDTLDRLEQLDDTVFAALSGDAQALDAAATAWQEARQEIDDRLLDQTRRHYIDRARSRWNKAQTQPEQRLAVGFAALEILDLLDEAA